MNKSLITGESISIQGIKYVGGYKMGSYISFCLPNKPNIVHRLFTRLLLGWEWVDYE